MSSSSHSTMQASGAARSITVRDVVSWKQEEAFRMGEIGFDTAFPDMNEIAQNFSYGDIDKNGWPAPAEDDSFLVAAAVELHDNVRSLQHHQHLMRQNPTIVTAAMKAVDQQLIALRRASKEKQRRSLREKVAELYELKHLKKKPNCVTVWVNPRPTTGLNQMMEVRIAISWASYPSIDATLDQSTFQIDHCRDQRHIPPSHAV